MSKSALVSVIIPTYKRAHLVSRAIESVRKQTYSNVEIIVVDDCSPDNTEAVVRAIPDDRIKYMRREKNAGLPGVTRNTGIREAKGEYIAFLDDDDEWREDKLEKQLRAMSNHHAVLCGAYVNGRIKIHKNSTVSLGDLRQGMAFDPSGLLAKADIIRELRFDENLREGEDWDLFIRIAQRYSIGYVAEPLIVYNDGTHQRVTIESRDQAGPALERRTAVLKKHRDFFGEKWFQYYVADTLISHLASRPKKLRSIHYAIKRCGVMPVLAVVAGKIRRHIGRFVFRGSNL